MAPVAVLASDRTVAYVAARCKLVNNISYVSSYSQRIFGTEQSQPSPQYSVSMS